jgi:rhodanese-related sulfurtransferase
MTATLAALLALAQDLAALREAVARGDAVLVDVRERSEWDAEHFPLARHLPLSRLKEGGFPEDLPKDKPVWVHCQSGVRSRTAAKLLKERGWDARALTQSYGKLKDAGVGSK